MNASRPNPTPSASSPRASNVIPMPERHVQRERDFGVGYGNSSGYASNRHYASSPATIFRCR